MRDKYRCLTCYQELTQEEYIQHKQEGHITVEYIEYAMEKTDEDTSKSS